MNSASRNIGVVKDVKVSTVSSIRLSSLPIVNVSTSVPPVVPSVKGGIVYDSVSNKVYFANGSTWAVVSDGTPSGPAGGALAGTYPNPTLAPGAVTSAALAPGAVTSAALAPGAVTSAALAPGAVTTAAIAPGAVTAAQIANNTITNVQIAPGTITNVQIAPGTITATEIAPGTITSVQIAPGAITAADIANNSITGTQLELLPGVLGLYNNPASVNVDGNGRITSLVDGIGGMQAFMNAGTANIPGPADIPFDTFTNLGGFQNLGNGLYQCDVSGTYFFTFVIRTAVGNVTVYLRVGASNFIETTNASTFSVSGSITLPVNAGTLVSMRSDLAAAYLGLSINPSNAAQCYFRVQRIY